MVRGKEDQAGGERARVPRRGTRGDAAAAGAEGEGEGRGGAPRSQMTGTRPGGESDYEQFNSSRDKLVAEHFNPARHEARVVSHPGQIPRLALETPRAAR